MHRVSVNGVSGSGKTTFARALAARLGVDYVELDELRHGRGWDVVTDDEFRELLAPLLESDGWVVDGNYHAPLGAAVLDRADTVIWLELPLTLTLWRLLRRTAGRIVRHEELWGGNRETLRGAFVGGQSLFVWTLRSRRSHRRTLPVRYARHPQVTVLHLRSQRAVDELLAGVGS